MAEKDITENLNQVLKKSDQLFEKGFSSEDLSCLSSAFLATNEDVAVLRPKGYMVLSAICRNVRTAMEGRNDGDKATQHLVQIFATFLHQSFGETDEKSLLLGASLLSALFQVDSLVASAIFAKDDLIEGIIDAIDLSPSPLLSQEITRLLSQAVGNRNCRGIVTPQIVRWLESKALQTSDPDLRVLASLALTKLSKGATSDPPENGTPDIQTHNTAGLVKTMVDVIISGNTGPSIDAVEGLAYLSVDPEVKENLARNPTFLKRLFALVPTKSTLNSKVRSNSSLIYGVSTIIYNLTCFRPRLSEEQQQMERLKRMAKAGRESDPEKSESLLDGDDHVKERIRLLISAGVLPVFPAAIAASDSNGVRLNVGMTSLSIVEEKENRGFVLQAGGAKVLQTIINLSLQGGSKEKDSMAPGPSDLPPIQALAKLAITSSPLQVFGPNVGAIYDTIRPFAILLQHPSSSLLQRFEAIMALTNLASYNADVASRIAMANGVVSKVELLFLEDRPLLRRAAVELICNLIVGSDKVFERYTGDSSASKIHILLALSDVDDTPTRLAASGALATLTIAASTCKVLVDLQFDHHRFLPIMMRLIDPYALPDELKDEIDLETNPALVNRGVVCLKNVFASIEGKGVRDRILDAGENAGLLQALVRLAKGEGISKDPSVMNLAAEAVKTLTG